MSKSSLMSQIVHVFEDLRSDSSNYTKRSYSNQLTFQLSVPKSNFVNRWIGKYSDQVDQTTQARLINEMEQLMEWLFFSVGIFCPYLIKK